MSGFIRRFGYYPGTEVLTQIEGVAIIDLPPPGSVEGVGTGVVAAVGECSDMTYATTVDSSGNVSTKIQPQEILSGQDLTNKFGGFDDTLGQFGGTEGNLLASLRNKKFSRLIVAPVNLASAKGSRMFRDLPMCRSQADSNPVVPVLGGSIAAGREFRSGVGRIKAARRVEFTAITPIKRDLGGNVIAGTSAVTQVFSSGKAFDRVWQFDDSGASFVDVTAVANSVAAADFEPFPAVDGTDDYVAFGMADTFEKLTLNNAGGTAGAGGVVAWEYWNGSAWAALTVVDGTTGFTAAVSAGQTVTWTAPTDWAANTLNAVLAYYVRARITTVYTTNPVYDRGFAAGVDWATIDRPDGNLGARKGDILVLGYNSAGSKAPAAEAGTYRVQTDPASGINVTIERLDGAAFVFNGQAGVPWRLHFASDADSAPVLVPGTAVGGYSASQDGGYTVAIRPITDASGAQTDGTYTAGSVLAPAVVPTATTGDSWDPLSGLGARLLPSTTTAFTAAVQGINPAYAGLDTAYLTAIDALLADAEPVRDTNIVVASRKSRIIRSKLRSHVIDASGKGRGRIAVISPPLTTLAVTDVTADADPGVGGNRSERVVYSWPGEQTYIPEAVGFRLATADGSTTVEGLLDVSADFRAASVLSNLAPERNPGQAADPVPAIMSTVLGIQRGVTGLAIGEYTSLRAAGVMGLRVDRTNGPTFQSGITTSLISGEKNILRRRMADFIQDSLAERLVKFSKLPLTNQLKDGAVGETVAFCDELLSASNPSAQRIDAYQVDDTSGNTPSLTAKGIHVIIVRVRLTPTSDFLVLQAEIGENVVIQQAA